VPKWHSEGGGMQGKTADRSVSRNGHGQCIAKRALIVVFYHRPPPKQPRVCPFKPCVFHQALLWRVWLRDYSNAPIGSVLIKFCALVPRVNWSQSRALSLYPTPSEQSRTAPRVSPSLPCLERYRSLRTA
jgi:hypothetical protein